MNGVDFGDVGPHLRTKTTPWLPPEVTIDALSRFDAIYLLNKFLFFSGSWKYERNGSAAK